MARKKFGSRSHGDREFATGLTGPMRKAAGTTVARRRGVDLIEVQPSVRASSPSGRWPA